MKIQQSRIYAKVPNGNQMKHFHKQQARNEAKCCVCLSSLSETAAAAVRAAGPLSAQVCGVIHHGWAQSQKIPSIFKTW